MKQMRPIARLASPSYGTTERHRNHRKITETNLEITAKESRDWIALIDPESHLGPHTASRLRQHGLE